MKKKHSNINAFLKRQQFKITAAKSEMKLAFNKLAEIDEEKKRIQEQIEQLEKEYPWLKRESE